MIICPPGIPPSPPQHTAPALSRHRVLHLPDHLPSLMPLPHLLPSFNSFLIPAYLSSRHTCWIPVTSSPYFLPKSLLTCPSIGYPPPSASTMWPVSAPRLRTPSPPVWRLQIWSGGPPTVPPLIDVYQCMSLSSASPLYSTRSNPLPPAMFH